MEWCCPLFPVLAPDLDWCQLLWFHGNLSGFQSDNLAGRSPAGVESGARNLVGGRHAWRALAAGDFPIFLEPNRLASSCFDDGVALQAGSGAQANAAVGHGSEKLDLVQDCSGAGLVSSSLPYGCRSRRLAICAIESQLCSEVIVSGKPHALKAFLFARGPRWNICTQFGVSGCKIAALVAV